MDTIPEEDLDRVVEMFITSVGRAVASKLEQSSDATETQSAKAYLTILEQSAKNLEQRLNIHTYKHRRGCNQQLPLYRLPNELLFASSFYHSESLITPGSHSFTHSPRCPSAGPSSSEGRLHCSATSRQMSQRRT
ncbi:hypothetical protein FRB94_011853 [Tulasnella sp. JGI-2019a]|nr:hypothetical protein FRB94_011853 [Tulasnella sp. JGI-2019a]KAG9014460.1 hypothetical protein FRB93_013585 [Tulasnella sp. JGI-2019a]